MTIPISPNDWDNVPRADIFDLDSVQLPEENDLFMPDNTTVFDKPITDKWIHVELNLPQGDLFWIGKVISRIKHGSCDATRSFYSKPFLNALTYDVEFSDGEIK